jgi:hypothetical protein
MCFGDGRCMKICRHYETCSLEHETSTYYFCKTECVNHCELIDCPNALHCMSSYPAYFYKEKNDFIINGRCEDCNLFKVTFLKEKRACLKCAHITYMIKTNCHHEMCFNCLLEIEGKIVRCPFCQKIIEYQEIH